MIKLDNWVLDMLANPVTKSPIRADEFPQLNGVIDARVFLKNTHGYSEWSEGQSEYEQWADAEHSNFTDYLKEIEYDRPVYERFLMSGCILDCGGGAGLVREFLPESVEFVSTDPWLAAPFAISKARREAYRCLNKPLNFIGAQAEFQPFAAESFDWVHMRSMLDHVQVVDLALLEARRVLKPDGRILIGLYVNGGKSGVTTYQRRIKDTIKHSLEMLGIDRWKDHHVWHPSFSALTKLINDNGLSIVDVYWQPQWKYTVCYVSAAKAAFSPEV